LSTTPGGVIGVTRNEGRLKYSWHQGEGGLNFTVELLRGDGGNNPGDKKTQAGLAHAAPKESVPCLRTYAGKKKVSK